MVCDALDLKGVEAVLDGCDAAITTLGGVPDGDESLRVDYAGNRNVIESAGILGITRVVMVTSLGCGSSREAISDHVYEVSLSATSIGKCCRAPANLVVVEEWKSRWFSGKIRSFSD